MAKYRGSGASGRSPRPVAVGVGSNLGRRAERVLEAVERLEELLGDLRCSRVYETEPAGVEGPLFLNLCCVGTTRLEPRALLEELLALERRAGRPDPPRRGARALDLDLLLYGSERVDESGLRIPHPRLTERAFVLVPLAEVAPGWVVPGVGETVAALARGVERSGLLSAGVLEDLCGGPPADGRSGPGGKEER